MCAAILGVDDARLELFRRALLSWWSQNAREYPWRHDRSPYSVAISEIMLRRTRADQVVPVYKRFLEMYPCLGAAANADPDEIKRLVWPLGLAWRADSMVAFFQDAHRRFGNYLPTDPAVLRSLPGVGDYVSAAIACFAGNEAVALIDANVVRVLGRVFGLDTRGEARRRRAMRDLARRAVDQAKPADYHYALLDFAARVCLPQKPLCSICPFSENSYCCYCQTCQE